MTRIPRLNRSLVYSAVLAVGAYALLVWATATQLVEPHPVVQVAGFGLFMLFAMVWAFPGPGIGYTSLDRVAQVAALLVFGPVEAAWIAGAAALLWPLLATRRARLPARALLARGLHASAMFVLMGLAGGWAYAAFGGEVPLSDFGLERLAQVVALALTLQLINELLFGIHTWVSGADPFSTFSWRTSLFELALVPLGVLTAVLYNSASTPVFALFAVLLVIIVLVVQALANMRLALEQRVDGLLAVNRIGRAISSSHVLDDLVELIFEECRKLFSFAAFYIVLYDEERQELDFRLHHNEQGRQPRKRKRLGEGALGWIIENNRPILIEDWDTDQGDFKRIAVIVGEAPKSVIGVPITYRNRVLGALSIQSFTPRTFGASDLNLMLTFADQVAVAIANARLFHELEQYKQSLEAKVEERTRALALQKEELYQLSESLGAANRQKEQLLDELRRKTDELDRLSKEDSLTGLFNRRYVDQRLEVELSRAERFQRPISVAMLDVDSFKRTNDEYSHGVADEVLRVIASILRGQCRGIDVIARYGGDEFVLCFPETDSEGAAMVCEKIRGAVERHPWRELHAELTVTISAGVATAPPVYDAERLLAAADAKLYAAKRAGRNRVCQ